MDNIFLNVFENENSSKQWRIKTQNLAEYSSKCEKMLFGVDEIKAISQLDGLKNAPCFARVSNDTNSDEIIIPGDYFSCGCFSSVSVSLSSCVTFIQYDVSVVYEENSYKILKFRFFDDNSRQVKMNGYQSDILIAGKAFRLEVVSGGEFEILTFLNELLCYQDSLGLNSRYLQYLGEYYITRYDYRFDFFHNNEISGLKYNEVIISPNMKHTNNVQDRVSKKIYTGWTAGNRKNHYVYTRMYQKQVEALDHGLNDLYFDYINYEGKVWRLEFEFGSDFTVKARGKHFLVDEFVDKKLQDMAFEYIGIKTPTGKFYQEKMEIPFDKRTTVSQKRSFSQFGNTGKSLTKCGKNPFLLLASQLKDFSGVDTIKKQLNETLVNIGNLDTISLQIEAEKISTKELYDRIYKNQLGFEQ